MMLTLAVRFPTGLQEIICLPADPLIENLQAFGYRHSIGGCQHGMPVVQHHDKGSQKNLPGLGVVAGRGAYLQGSHFADDFLSWLNTLGDEERSWALHLPVEPETPGMRLLNGLFHFIDPKKNVGASGFRVLNRLRDSPNLFH